MIAVGTSTLVAYLAGEAGSDVDELDKALAPNQARLPPVVLTETLSASNITMEIEQLVLALLVLDVFDGYWQRAGQNRRNLLGRRLRAPLADTLICQSCLDHDLALLTRDGDFKRFAAHCDLRLA